MRAGTASVFRVVSYLEGLSFLVLLLIAMPLKYAADMPEAVAIVGMAHGVLFALFLAGVAVMAVLFRWRLARIAGAVAAAFLPFGPFVLERRIRKDGKEGEEG
ncbi:membrane protein [Cohnella xylanilytica]|uniref:DUF3817 domain-containing protein n=1 Tax=Cohnella xylanilytica TaxID=557555 RepID=A0A841U9M4_9BACL|nr:DUF3817 domain-containing protein [Cohnella xylanilytica]MBB6694671.1 DUF3817 domain-containing protein [Cohnella xylanilytica]GIO14311.1 membrane protein [Cohnella xylanilytica]